MPIRNNGGKVVGKTTELLPITKRIDGSMMGIPVIKIVGESNGPTLLLVGGIHGDEPEGIIPILDMVDQLDPAHLHGTVIGIPVVNIPACSARRRGNPLEDWHYDINRVFPGTEKGSLTQRLAHKMISEIVPQADMLIAIHSGGNNFYCCERAIIYDDSENNMRLAKALGPGWDLIAKGAGERKKAATLTAIASHNGLPSLTVEIGGVCDRLPDRFNEKVQAVVSMLQNVMKEYNMVEGKPTYADELIMMDYYPIRNNHGGLIRFGENCRTRRELKKGEEIITITDFFGKPIEVVRAPFDGMLVAIPAQIVVATGGFQIGSIGKIIKRIRT